LLHGRIRFPARMVRITGSLRPSMTPGAHAALPGAVRPMSGRVRARGRLQHMLPPAAGHRKHQTLRRRFADDRDLIAVKVLLLTAMGILTAVLEAVI
jgi:hypothetical protein